MGMDIGSTQDTVSWSHERTTVSSLFTPSRNAQLLGAPSIQRRWSYAPDEGTLREEKTTTKDTNETVQWAIQNARLVRTDGSGKREEFPSTATAHRYLDSTIFPYVALTGLSLQGNEWIINNQTPYQATIRKTANRLVYDANGHEGEVELRHGVPIRLQLQTKAGLITAKQMTQQCTTD